MVVESTGIQSPYENRLHLRRRVFAGGQASIVSVKAGQETRDETMSQDGTETVECEKAAIRTDSHHPCAPNRPPARDSNLETQNSNSVSAELAVTDIFR